MDYRGGLKDEKLALCSLTNLVKLHVRQVSREKLELIETLTKVEAGESRRGLTCFPVRMPNFAIRRPNKT